MTTKRADELFRLFCNIPVGKLECTRAAVVNINGNLNAGALLVVDLGPSDGVWLTAQAVKKILGVTAYYKKMPEHDIEPFVEMVTLKTTITLCNALQMETFAVKARADMPVNGSGPSTEKRTKFLRWIEKETIDGLKRTGTSLMIVDESDVNFIIKEDCLYDSPFAKMLMLAAASNDGDMFGNESRKGLKSVCMNFQL